MFSINDTIVHRLVGVFSAITAVAIGLSILGFGHVAAAPAGSVEVGPITPVHTIAPAPVAAGAADRTYG